MHHDYERTLTGNTFYLLWEPMPADLSARVRGGVRIPEDPIHMLGDTIREIDGDCRDCPRVEDMGEAERRGRSDLPPRRPARVDSRQLDQPHERRRLPGQLPTHQQHRDRLTRDRRHHLEMGFAGHDQPPAPRYSARRGQHPDLRQRVALVRQEQLARDRGEPGDQQRSSGPTKAVHPRRSTAPTSAARDRLPNGNTLICEGAHGRLFEVTRRGEIVWEYINPFFALDGSGMNLSNATFRVHRYPPDFPGFTERDLDPARHANLNRLLGVV